MCACGCVCMYDCVCVCLCAYVYVYVCHCLISCVNFTCSYIFSLAFSQPATGPSSVCEGSDVTLQCVVVLNNSDNTATVLSTLWSRNINGMITAISTLTPIPNHRLVFNSTTGAFTDLVITNVILEDDNTVYSCTTVGATITSSVVLNVTGNMCKCEHSY